MDLYTRLPKLIVYNTIPATSHDFRKSPIMFVLTIAAYYLLIGCAFGVAFFWRGYAIIAPQARGASMATRLIWMPAAIALWPLLARKWQANRQRTPDQ